MYHYERGASRIKWRKSRILYQTILRVKTASRRFIVIRHYFIV